LVHGIFAHHREGKEMQSRTLLSVSLLLVLEAAIFCEGCGSKSSTQGSSLPAVQNVNSSTTPTSPVNLPIEINGSGFQSAPGKVMFTQGSISVSVTPATSAWSDTGIVVVVPAGNGVTNFTIPGTVSVTVVTSGGTSNSVLVKLVAMITFNPSQMSWATTTPLPTALTGLRAVAVPGATNTSAIAIVTGGYNGSGNTTTVLSNTLSSNGTLGGAWDAVATSPLPTTVAHHTMAEADPTNSLVASDKAYVYVIGGQTLPTDVGGKSSIYMASVDPTSGAVGTWTQLTKSLPQALMGASATVHNGYLYVTGGLNTNGAPVTAVYSAPVNADGTIGTWTTATNVLPKARAFGTMVVFGGIIYYLNGDPNASISPNHQGVGDKDVYYASAVHGVIGTWTLNGNFTIHDRAKGVLFTAFGQFIVAEGVYTGSVGSGEMESSSVNAQNTTNVALNPWTGLTGSQAARANLYNAAGFTSPLFAPTTNGPRFLILGGQAHTGSTGAGGALRNTVYYNTAP
jgi:hypothetical protein